jgi:hypothetical protein
VPWLKQTLRVLRAKNTLSYHLGTVLTISTVFFLVIFRLKIRVSPIKCSSIGDEGDCPPKSVQFRNKRDKGRTVGLKSTVIASQR